jgi:hypothetical protein
MTSALSRDSSTPAAWHAVVIAPRTSSTGSSAPSASAICQAAAEILGLDHSRELLAGREE